MTPAVTRSCRWHTRLLYGVLWAAPVAIASGIAVAVQPVAGLVVAGVLVALVGWRVLQTGLYADDAHLAVRTVTGSRLVAWQDIAAFFWRAPRLIGGTTAEGLDTRSARLHLRTEDGSERRLPAMVWSPAGADRVDQTLRRWTGPAGVAIVPLVAPERRAGAG